MCIIRNLARTNFSLSLLNLLKLVCAINSNTKVILSVSVETCIKQISYFHFTKGSAPTGYFKDTNSSRVKQ